MPSAADHSEKYVNNKAFLDKIKSNQPTKGRLLHGDWIATVSFYAALHLVEMRLAQLGHENLITDHQTRVSFMRQFNEFKAIADDYNTLKNESYRARYSNKKFDRSDIREITQCLNSIEKRYPV